MGGAAAAAVVSPLDTFMTPTQQTMDGTFAVATLLWDAARRHGDVRVRVGGTNDNYEVMSVEGTALELNLSEGTAELYLWYSAAYQVRLCPRTHECGVSAGSEKWGFLVAG